MTQVVMDEATAGAEAAAATSSYHSASTSHQEWSRERSGAYDVDPDVSLTRPCQPRRSDHTVKGKRQGDRMAAGVILLVGRGRQPEKVVVTCQQRKYGPSWELPKGGMDDDRAEVAAAREFWEETGITNDLTRLSPLHGYGAKRIHWFLAHVGEDSELMWEPSMDKDTLDAKCVMLEEAKRILRDDHKHLLNHVLGDIARGKLRW